MRRLCIVLWRLAPPVMMGGASAVSPGDGLRSLRRHAPTPPPRLGLRRSSVPRKAGDSVRRARPLDSAYTQSPGLRGIGSPAWPPILGVVPPQAKQGEQSVPPGTEPRGHGSHHPAVATPQRNPPVSRGIGERPARDRAEGAQPQPPPRLGLRALVGPPQSGRQREKVLLRGTPGALRPPTAAPHAIPRSAATPSTRPSALAGPPQSGRQRRRSGKQCLGRREHAPNAIPRSPGESASVPPGTEPRETPHPATPSTRPPALAVPRKAGDSVRRCSSVGRPAREDHSPQPPTQSPGPPPPPRLGLRRSPVPRKAGDSTEDPTHEGAFVGDFRPWWRARIGGTVGARR